MNKNKKAGFTDIFLFIILTFSFVLIFGIILYAIPQIKDKMHLEMDNITTEVPASVTNYTKLIDNTIGKVDNSYQSLYWIAIFLIIGMLFAIFIGSYNIQTKPVYFVHYIIMIIIAVVISAGISNSYNMVKNDSNLSSTFNKFIGANFILSYLPLWVLIIGLGGAIIMYSKMQKITEYI